MKTHCHYGYSILGEKPPKIDVDADYIIVCQSIYFPNCVIIKRKDSCSYDGNTQWIVPKSSMY